MYAHVKTGVSLARYVIQCWRSNHEWIIEEYRASRDERYSHKLEQLRRKINGKLLLIFMHRDFFVMLQNASAILPPSIPITGQVCQRHANDSSC
uniref:Helitron_like_N domain-containing protein n=1 Tax=Ascaris lumbricoides TaxID=6252 RepID=A0A0M3ISG6_ASCLU